MWLYSRPEDTTRVHPEEVTEETVAQWLWSITGTKTTRAERSRSCRSILRIFLKRCGLSCRAFTNMYSPVPNGEPHQGESEGSGDIEYAEDNRDDISDDSDDADEVESPPRLERCSKQTQDPAVDHGKVATSSEKTQKRAWTATPDPSEKVSKKWCHFWSVPHGS
ncbi:hypothetical protein VPH35_053614 [Triticum aestivum]